MFLNNTNISRDSVRSHKPLFRDLKQLKKDIKKYFQKNDKKRSLKKRNLGFYFKKKTKDGYITVYRDLQGKELTGNVAFYQHKQDQHQLKEREKVLQTGVKFPQERNQAIELDISSSSLQYYGIPQSVINIYHQLHIKELYPWQIECLHLPDVFHPIFLNSPRKHLIYSASTSAGKTLVAEILLLTSLLVQNCQAIIILPFISMVIEKTADLHQKYSPLGLIVKSFYGSQAIDIITPEIDVYVCTIEKGVSLINQLMASQKIQKIGYVMIDEIHLITDGYRGFQIELILAKLLYWFSLFPSIALQIVGLTATASNLTDLSQYLKAQYYSTSFRPVTLQHYLKFGSKIYDQNLTFCRNVAPSIPEDVDQIIPLCLEMVKDGYGVLVFCPTREWTQNCSILIAKGFSQLSLQITPSTTVLSSLSILPSNIDPLLKKTLQYRVAYHHAGLSTEERHIIEKAFRSGQIGVLVCTSTLALGVNLPCRRVIFRNEYMGNHRLDSSHYHQMSGRAGRAGIDSQGESIMIISSSTHYQKNSPRSSLKVQEVLDMMKGTETQIKSSLSLYSLSRYIIECLCLNLLHHIEEVQVKELMEESLKFLQEKRFIRFNQNDLVPTILAQATFNHLSVCDSLSLFDDLQNLRQVLYRQHSTLSPNFCQKFHLNKNFIEKQMAFPSSLSLSSSSSVLNDLNSYKKCYVAFILHDLIEEHSLEEIGKQYHLSKGKVQELQQYSSRYAGLVSNFCYQLNYINLSYIYAHLRDRIEYAAKSELLPFQSISGLNSAHARLLYQNGYDSLEKLTTAMVDDLVQIFLFYHKFSPNDKDYYHDIKTSYYQSAETIIINAQNVLQNQIDEMERNELDHLELEYMMFEGEPIFLTPSEPDLESQSDYDIMESDIKKDNIVNN